MALQVRERSGGKILNLIALPVFMLALVAQPLYGLVAGQVASAAEVAEDKEKPVVSFVTPVSSVLSSSAVISIKATDNQALNRVVGSIYKDNALYKSTQVSAQGAKEKIHTINLKTVMSDGSALPDGAYTLRYNASDIAGNISVTKFFSFKVDSRIPTITIKDSSKGVGGVYTKIDFKLADNDKIAKAVINGYEKPLSPNQYSDVNDVKVGAVGGKYGSNTIRVYDLAGNEATLSFILDNKAPTVTLKDGGATVGTGPYSRVSFKLYDDYKIAKAEVNGQVIPLSPNQWSDLNNIKVGSMGGKLGPNVVKVYDVVGNVTEVPFDLDNVAPTVESLTHSNNNDNALVNTDVTSTLKVSEPITTPSGWTEVGGDGMTFEKVSTANNKGNMTIVDLAGNSLTFFFEVKRIDKTAPVFDIEDGSVITLDDPTVEVTATEDNISKIIVDGQEAVFTGEKPDYKVTVSGFGDHTIIARDKAGNEAEVNFTIRATPDTTAPNIMIVSQVATTDAITISGTTDDPASPVVITLNGRTRTVTPNADGTWAVTFTGLSSSTSYAYTIVSADASGNTNETSEVMWTRDIIEPVVEPPLQSVTRAAVSSGASGNSAPTSNVFANSVVTLPGTTTEDSQEGEVLGAQTERENSVASQVAAVDTTTAGWKIFGVLWYWWVLAVAALVGVWWIIAAARRRKQDDIAA